MKDLTNIVVKSVSEIDHVLQVLLEALRRISAQASCGRSGKRIAVWGPLS